MFSTTQKNDRKLYWNLRILAQLDGLGAERVFPHAQDTKARGHSLCRKDDADLYDQSNQGKSEVVFEVTDLSECNLGGGALTSTVSED